MKTPSSAVMTQPDDSLCMLAAWILAARRKPVLTDRQMQVAELVAQGHANKEIGYRLGIGEGTVKEYIFRIFKVLGLSNRTELAMWYARNYGSPEVAHA